MSRPVQTVAQPQPDEAQVATTRKKFLRRQRARRWLVWRRVLGVLLAVAVVAGLVWLFFFSTLLAAKGAEVAGIDVLEASEVKIRPARRCPGGYAGHEQ